MPDLVSDFPATVTLPARQVTAARAVVSDGTLYVWAAERRQPVLVFRSPLTAPFEPPTKPRPGQRREAGTEAGPVSWTVSGSCGCGNPLKSLRTETLLTRYADAEVAG